MKTTLRSLLLVTATAVFVTSFAEARHGNQAANTGTGSRSNGSVQRQATPGQCPAATPSQEGAAKREAARAANREKAPANGTANAQSGSGYGKTQRKAGSTDSPPTEG